MSPLRVVGGEARGKPLRAPRGWATRPTSDRVREAMFDVLASLEAVEGVVVADLFAGSGALGIEALSRGAAHVWFVDHDRSAIAAVRANLAATGFDGRGHIVRADVLRWLEQAPRVGLVLCDPPYGYDRWPALLGALHEPSGLVLLETGEALHLGSDWEVLKVKRYGGTVVTVARPVDEPAREADQKGDM